MKTNRYKILVTVGLLAIAGGCADKLNIQPQQNVDNTLALQNSKDVESLLIGAYSQLGSTNLFGGGFTVEADLLAAGYNDIGFYGTFQELTQMANKGMNINNAFVSGMWLDAYSVINTCNVVLDHLALVDDENRDRVKGEALFIRGTVYFNLVKFFGRYYNDGDPKANPGVPLVLVPTYNLDDALKSPARNSVFEVYGQAVTDLSTAGTLLDWPENNSYYYATKGSAFGQLARIYLMEADYEHAAAYADSVIASGYYQLTNTYAENFPYVGRAARIFNTSEDIFAQQVSEQNGVNGNNTYYASPDQGGRGDIEMYQDFLDSYEDGDARVALFHDDGSGSYYYSAKWDNQFGNVKLMRLAEMYLIRAEANVMMGSGGTVGDSPLNDLNTVRLRANLEPFSDNPTQADILHEKFYELAFEGVWLDDYKRTNTSILISPADDQGDPEVDIFAQDPALIFPIPQREIIVNKSLVQNVGY